MNKTELIESLKSTMAETISFFDLTENDLAKSYGSGKWNIKQILHHLTDSELIFQYRLKAIIAEPKQVIWAYDQDRFNEAFDYKSKNLQYKKQLFELCRKLNLELIEEFYDLLCDKEFVHSSTGLHLLKDEFERVYIHNWDHIKQIKKALS